MEETRLGAILLESGIIREEDLERCLEIQSLTGGDRPLGQVLVDQGIVPAETLDRLLELQSARRRGKTNGEPQIAAEDTEVFLQEAIKRGASELHLSEGRLPMIRTATELVPLGDEEVIAPEIWFFVQQHMGPDVLESLAEQRSVTQPFLVEGEARGRITATRHFEGIQVVIRLHPWQVRPLHEIEPDPRLADTLTNSRGLLLVCGEHGSGVSETMASMLDAITSGGSDRFVLVLDENLEFQRPTSPDAIVSVRRVREHTRDYVTGLMSALYEDPDVLIVGDVSDPRAFDIALRAAETERLVVAGLPAAGTTEALERIELGYADRDLQRVRMTLASVLRGVLTVRLLPSADGTGARMATEYLAVDDSVRDLLGGSGMARVDLLLQMGDSNIGHGLDGRLLELVRTGEVAFEDAFTFARDKARLMASASREA